MKPYLSSSPRSWITLALLAGFACRSEPLQALAPAAERPLAAPAPDATPATTVERVIELGRSDNHVQDHLRHLCKEIGPRLTGSTQLRRASEWASDTFASWGLTSWIEPWGEFPVGFDRGPWSGGMVAPEKLDFVFNTMSWTPGTHGPARGPALAFPTSEDELAALEGRIAGAWLVRPPATAGKDAEGNELFAKPDQPSNALVTKVQRAIEEQGGLGEVRGASGDLLLTGGRQNISWNDLPKRVDVRVRRDHHDQLWARMEAGTPVELEFDIDNRFVEGPVPLSNVVADLVGREKPDEYVIVCGHLDSWDGAEGAVDNGTGVATTMEAARLLVQAGAKPARTIRFLLWSGEEQGLLGSRAYVEAHPELMGKISAVFNHDEGTNYLGGLAVTAEMMPAMQLACAPLFGLHPEFGFELRETDGLSARGASDHASFVQVGVPGFFWRQVGRSVYRQYHHTQYDTFDAAIPEYQEHSAIVAALTALGVANLPELLDRTNLLAPEPRRMGVYLDGTRLTRVMEQGRAHAAGLKGGDEIVAIDGVEMASRDQISEVVGKGGSVKVFRVKRGEELIEATLDWSSEPDEPRRLARMAEREARGAASGDESSKP